MRANTDLRVDTAEKPDLKVPLGIWIGGVTARTLFLIVLTVVIARVASPQSETIWSVFETPGDFIRVALGFAVCTWFVVNLFMLPKRPRRIPDLGLPGYYRAAFVIALRRRHLVNPAIAVPGR